MSPAINGSVREEVTMSSTIRSMRPAARKLLTTALAAVATWLVSSPLVLGYPTEVRQRALVVDLLIGTVLLLLALLRLLTWNGTSWASRVGLSLGLLLMVLPVCLGYRLDPYLMHAGLNEVLTGLAVVVLSWLSLRASGTWAD